MKNTYSLQLHVLDFGTTYAFYIEANEEAEAIAMLIEQPMVKRIVDAGHTVVVGLADEKWRIGHGFAPSRIEIGAIVALGALAVAALAKPIYGVMTGRLNPVTWAPMEPA